MVKSNLRGSNPADGAAAVTPNDSADLSFVARALYVGGAGNIKIDTPNGDTVTLYGATAGSVLPVRANRVYSTGTTATNIVALY
jgi:hypothetical protein